MSSVATYSTIAARATRPTWLDGLAFVIALGYLLMSRTFAHIGISPLFIGELVLVTFVLARPDILLRPLLYALVRPSSLSGFAWAAVLFMAFGAVQFLRGIMSGFNPFIAAQNLAFHWYVFFFFVGVWLGRRHVHFLAVFLRWLAWCNGIYGFLFIVVLSPLGWTMLDEGETIPWFGQPYGAAIALLGILSFEKDLRRAMIPLLLNSFVLFGLQVRAVWLGFSLCLLLWSLLAGRLAQFFKVVSVLVALLAIGFLVDFRLPGPVTRGGEISTRALIGRALAPISRDFARELNKNADDYANTADWRVDWWREIWTATHASSARMLVGPGYGYPLWELHPWDLGDQLLRTPHNIFVHALGYTGWVGVAVFALLLAALAQVLWRAYLLTGQPFGPCLWVLIVAWAAFDGLLEAPYGAIPFYLLCGLSVAPLVRSADRNSTSCAVRGEAS